MPERLADDFRSAAARNPDVKFLASTGNVTYIVTRLMLPAGKFNYGRWGISISRTRA